MLKPRRYIRLLQLFLIFSNYIIHSNTHLSSGSSALASASVKARGPPLEKSKVGPVRARKLGNDDDVEIDSKSKFYKSFFYC